MAQSVRVEFVMLGTGGNPLNIIYERYGSAIHNLPVTNTPTDPQQRPVVPSDGNRGALVRLIAKENPVYFTWGSDPTATLENSIELVVGIPEVVYLNDGDMLSFIAENA